MPIFSMISTPFQELAESLPHQCHRMEETEKPVTKEAPDLGIPD